MDAFTHRGHSLLLSNSFKIDKIRFALVVTEDQIFVFPHFNPIVILLLNEVGGEV